LGFSLHREWSGGQSWSAGGAYLTLTTSPNLANPVHDRRRVGLNHLAFKAGEQKVVDAIMADAPGHGWRPLYPEVTTAFRAEIRAHQVKGAQVFRKCRQKALLHDIPDTT